MDADALRDELDGALVPMDRLPDSPPPWHRRARYDWRRMAGDLAVVAGLVALGWLPAILGVWLLFAR